MADKKATLPAKKVDTSRPEADQWLPEKVAQKYTTVGWIGGSRQVFGRKFGLVDLEKLTLAQVEALIKRGFTKLAAL